MTIVAYYRVSTAQQGRSGLGLEAQRTAVLAFAKAEGLEIIAEYTEIETGKGADALDRRPQLAAALKHAKRQRASVCVAKLDRLSRDVAFIASLMVRRVGPQRRPVHAAHLRCPGRAGAPDDQPAHSRRPPGGQGTWCKAGQRQDDRGHAGCGREARCGAARHAAPDDRYTTIAEKLTKLGIETPRGGKVWSHVTVQRVMARLGF